MSKNVAELIKYIRKQNKLTQKQFANKFFITEKTVSNYENGLRTPDLDFLNKVCEEFNLTLDYFMETSKTESNPNNLVVSEKNGKCAIYDKNRSVYLTPHIYDRVILSHYDSHIAYNANDLVDEGRVIPKMGEVAYSAIIDNFGNVKALPNLIFAYNYNLPFNMFNVCPALNKVDNKFYLLNSNGELLSKGYERIVAIDKWHADSEHDFGLYYGLEYKQDRLNNEKSIKSRKLLYVDGKEIKVTLTDINDNWDCKVKEFESIDVLVKYIKKYGPNMITLAPDLIFKASENYPKIVNSVCEYVDSLNENIKCENFLNYTLKVITEYATNYKPKAQCVSQSELYPNKIFAKNIIEANSLRKQISDLYDIIGLV